MVTNKLGQNTIKQNKTKNTLHNFDEQSDVVTSKGKNQALELGPPLYNLEFLQASVFPSVKRGILQFALKDFFLVRI